MADSPAMRTSLRDIGFLWLVNTRPDQSYRISSLDSIRCYRRIFSVRFWGAEIAQSAPSFRKTRFYRVTALDIARRCPDQTRRSRRHRRRRDRRTARRTPSPSRPLSISQDCVVLSLLNVIAHVTAPVTAVLGRVSSGRIRFRELT